MNLRWLFPSSNAIEDATACTFRSVEEFESILVFAGNLVLIVGLLIFIFVLHVAIASCMETYMILKARAFNAIKTARDQGISINDLSSRVMGRHRRNQHPQLVGSLDIEDNLDASSFGSRRGENGTDAHSTREELMECRDKSNSVWLHFPHLELIFLFFAFQGAVASQLGPIRYSGLSCPSVFFTALVFLVSPLILQLMLIRSAIYILFLRRFARDRPSIPGQG